MIYKCGSAAFGTSTDKSDEDYVVVLKDFKGLTHLGDGKKEYFIFGVETWKEKQEFSDDLDEYFEIYNDEILALPETIIYQDEAIKDLVENYKKTFESKYKIWLQKVVVHYDYYWKLGVINKRMYHLVRIKHIIENYKKFGSFSLDLSKEVLNWILKFKEAEDKTKYRNVLSEALTYIKNEGGNLE